MRRQKNAAKDQADTVRFHRWLSRLKVPRRPVDGVKWNPSERPLWPPGRYWPLVRVDVRMLK